MSPKGLMLEAIGMQVTSGSTPSRLDELYTERTEGRNQNAKYVSPENREDTITFSQCSAPNSLENYTNCQHRQSIFYALTF